MNNNQKLIDAVNCKFPQNNLTEIYYNMRVCQNSFFENMNL